MPDEATPSPHLPAGIQPSDEIDVTALQYPQWQAPYQAALLELDSDRLSKRLDLAEMLITRRLQAIERDSDCAEERRALRDAMAGLRGLRQNPAG